MFLFLVKGNLADIHVILEILVLRHSQVLRLEHRHNIPLLEFGADLLKKAPDQRLMLEPVVLELGGNVLVDQMEVGFVLEDCDQLDQTWEPEASQDFDLLFDGLLFLLAVEAHQPPNFYPVALVEGLSERVALFDVHDHLTFIHGSHVPKLVTIMLYNIFAIVMAIQ